MTDGFNINALLEVLAKHVTGLNFSYKMGDNTAFTIGTHNPEDIRSIKISLSGRSRKPDPSLKNPTTGAKDYRTLTITGEVKSRNLAIASNPADATPPAVPTDRQRVAAELTEFLACRRPCRCNCGMPRNIY